jgi:hypothetical protein
MLGIGHRITSLRAMTFCGLAAISVVASALPPRDPIYIHCRNAGSDFRISELNHSVSQLSDKFQEYRPVCRECDIVEWGDRITMRDGDKTIVQVNRMTGDINIQRNDAKDGAGPTDLRSYRGMCVKGNKIVPMAGGQGASARAF